MNKTIAPPETIPKAVEGTIWGISAVLVIIIVVTNILTIYVIRRVAILREKYGILFVAYCSVDVLAGLHIIYLQLRLWFVPDVPTCKWRDIVLNIYDNLPHTSSTWHTVLLTLDRYIAVCYPFQYHRIMSSKIQKILIAVVWLISICEAFGLQLYYKAFECSNMIWNGPKNLDTRYQLGHLTVIFMFHVVMYSRIWWIAHKMRQRSVEAFSDNPPVRRGIVDKATMTVFCVVVLSHIIWLPYALSHLFSDNKLFSSYLYVRLSLLIGLSGSFINNIIYITMNKTFRNGFKRLLCKGNM